MESDSEVESDRFSNSGLKKSSNKQTNCSGSVFTEASTSSQRVSSESDPEDGETSLRGKRKRDPGHKPVHHSQKTKSSLSAREVDRVLKIIASSQEIPSKLRSAADLADDLEIKGNDSWIFVKIIKTGAHKYKHKQKLRFLHNLREDENLCEIINKTLADRVISEIQDEEEKEEEHPPAEKNEAPESDDFLFSELNLVEYFLTEEVLILHGNDRDKNLGKHPQHNKTLRPRAGPSGSQKSAETEPNRPVQPKLLDEIALRKGLKAQRENVDKHPQPEPAISIKKVSREIPFPEFEKQDFLARMAMFGGVYRGWQMKIKAAPSTSAEFPQQASTSAPTKPPSLSASTSSSVASAKVKGSTHSMIRQASHPGPSTASTSSRIGKAGGAHDHLPRPTAKAERPEEAQTQATRAAEHGTAAESKGKRRSHSAPRQLHLPAKVVSIKAADIKKRSKGNLLDKNNQPCRIFENQVRYKDFCNVLVTVLNMCGVNALLHYMMDVALDKAGRKFLKMIIIGAHPLIRAFVIEVLGEKQVRVHITTHMECIRASMAKFLLLQINDQKSILKNTATEFEGTAINVSPVVILNIFTVSSYTRQYIYSEARLKPNGHREICSHIQGCKIRDTAIPYVLFKEALQTGVIPNVPIKFPCSCGATASMKAILSEDGFFIKFPGRGLCLTRDNIKEDLPPRASMERMKYRLHALLIAYFTFQDVAHSMVLVAKNRDYCVLDDGSFFRTTSDAKEFCVTALLANYVRDDE